MNLNNIFCVTLFLVLSSNFCIAQKITPFQINGELFELPGKWKLEGQIEKSGQYHFTNKSDKLSALISVRKPEKFEFYEEGLTEEELLNKFYKWEFDYWSTENINSKVSEVKKDKNYVIWKMILENLSLNDNKDHTTYFLYAVRNNRLIAITLNNSSDVKKPLTEDESIDFLERIYLK